MQPPLSTHAAAALAAPGDLLFALRRSIATPPPALIDAHGTLKLNRLYNALISA